MINLEESFDQIYPITRVESKYADVFDMWEFEVSGQIFTVKFSRLDPKAYGKKISRVEFGRRRGKQIRRGVEGVSNIRKYLATIMSVLETASKDPSKKLSVRSDGFILVMDPDIFNKHGKNFLRIFKRKFLQTFKIHSKYFEFQDEDTNAFYIHKKERSFSSVFSALDIEDSPEVLDEPKKKEVTFKIADMIAAKFKETDSAPVDTKTSDMNKMVEAKKRGTSLLDKPIDLDAWFRVAIVLSLFKNQIPKSDSDSPTNKTSIDPSTIDITLEDIEAYRAVDMTKNAFSELSEKEYLVALNLSNIGTGSSYDLLTSTSSYLKSNIIDDFKKAGVNTAVMEDINADNMLRDVPLDQIMEICKEAKKILDINNITITEEKRGYNFKRPIDANLSPHGILMYAGLSESDLKKHFSNVLATLNAMELNAHSVFKLTKSAQKTVREVNLYSRDNSPIITAVISLSDMAREISKTPEEYLAFIERLPSFAQDIFSDNLDVFESSFIKNWTRSGGSFAQVVAHKTSSDMQVNAALDDFWNGETSKNDIREGAVDLSKKKIRTNLESIYEKSQDFFKAKFKKSYENKTITLYRGVGSETVDVYVPGALESWTTQISTAKKFASMMSRSDKSYTILYAEVPIQHIFGSWESFEETWPAEEDLVGKKEYIVMGGTFATTELFRYDSYTKEKTGQLKAFREWFLHEGKNMTDKIKIMTPSMKGFDKIIKSSSTAKGNDPKENEARKPVKKGS